MTDLDKLIAAVEAGDGPGNHALALETLDQVKWCVDAWRGSLDAAHRLHEALLPGWIVENIGNACFDGTGGSNVRLAAPDYLKTFMHSTANAATPARAWLLAILRALKAKGEAS